MMLPFIPVETFFDAARAAEIWPDSIVRSEDFVRQVEQRIELSRCLNDVRSALPRADMHLHIAIEKGYVSESQTAELYESLCNLLEDDDYKRLLLYLPFEFLPRGSWRPSEKKLQQATERFERTYMRVWKRLLWIHDVRANFVDGDVLESECRIGDLPRVVKAAHLIPKLTEAGFITIKDVVTLMDESNDWVLKNSIADALYAVGLGEQREPSIMPGPDSTITKKRRTWLKQVEEQEAIAALAEDICAAILDSRFTRVSTDNPEALVEGIRKAVEKHPALYTQYKKPLLTLWEESNDPDTTEALLKAFRRFHRLGITDESVLDGLGIKIPDLGGPFFENLQHVAELPDIQRIVSSVESDPELSGFIYPAVLLYGSRLSGYGTQNADIDLAVFVKPGIPFSARPRIEELLKKTFTHKKIHGEEITEFWLEEDGDKLTVCDFAHNTSTGESSWTHVLFGAAWLGEQAATRKLCRKLLVPYMGARDRDVREQHVEQMERTVLQYRLMHNGYERFFPPSGGVNVPHSDAIDGTSAFWDSGYRQLATKLFIDRVFLPKVSSSKI